jgi:hypothetical protein
MNLAENRFSKTELLIRVVEYPPYSEDIKTQRYTYETGKAIYDVDIPCRAIRAQDGSLYKRWYAINGKTQLTPERIHKIIEAHFNLE